MALAPSECIRTVDTGTPHTATAGKGKKVVIIK